MTKLIEFRINNNTDEEILFFENLPIRNTGEANESFSLASVDSTDKIVGKASTSFETTIARIKPMINSLSDTFKAVSPDEFEVEFGLKLNAVAGVIISSAEAEVHFVVKMTWKKGKT